jgi:hypothetical protein
MVCLYTVQNLKQLCCKVYVYLRFCKLSVTLLLVNEQREVFMSLMERLCVLPWFTMSDACFVEFVLLSSTITWCKTYINFCLNVSLLRDLRGEVSFHLTIEMKPVSELYWFLKYWKRWQTQARSSLCHHYLTLNLITFPQDIVIAPYSTLSEIELGREGKGVKVYRYRVLDGSYQN